jgi:hypothetical protein
VMISKPPRVPQLWRRYAIRYRKKRRWRVGVMIK